MPPTPSSAPPGWRGVIADFGRPGAVTIGDLVNGWQRDVHRFVDEQHSSLEDRTVWAAHDYIGALCMRDALEREINALPNADHAEAAHAVAAADKVLRGITEPDETVVLGGFYGARPDSPNWWWHCVPTSGPVREEMDPHQPPPNNG